jgi:hypothetical protein
MEKNADQPSGRERASVIRNRMNSTEALLAEYKKAISTACSASRWSLNKETLAWHDLLNLLGLSYTMRDFLWTRRRTNLKVFQVVLQMQQRIGRIPAQVEREKPVYMIDALGRHSPFHLEFVRSAEVRQESLCPIQCLFKKAFVALLKSNLKNHGTRAQKIEKGEFVIQDAITKRDFDLRTDWETCFVPGQKVTMSMILTRALVPDVKCPKCDAPNIHSSIFGRNVDIDW